MKDKTRLLDRTRLKRTTFDVLGKATVVEKEVAPPADDNDDNEQVRTSNTLPYKSRNSALYLSHP